MKSCNTCSILVFASIVLVSLQYKSQLIMTLSSSKEKWEALLEVVKDQIIVKHEGFHKAPSYGNTRQCRCIVSGIYCYCFKQYETCGHNVQVSE